VHVNWRLTRELFDVEANQNKKADVPDTIFNLLEMTNNARILLEQANLGEKGKTVTQNDIAMFLSGRTNSQSSARSESVAAPAAPGAVERSSTAFSRGLVSHYQAMIKRLGGVGSRAYHFVRDGCRDVSNPVFTYSSVHALCLGKANNCKEEEDVLLVRVPTALYNELTSY